MTHNEEQRGGAEPTAEMLQRLAGDLDCVVASEAAYQIARRVALLSVAPWTRHEPDATAQYLAARSAGRRPASPQAVAEFEVSARALFALAYGRMPDIHAELAAFMDAWFERPT